MSLLGAGNKNAFAGADKIAAGFTQAGASGLFSGIGGESQPIGNVTPGYAANSYQSMAPVSQGGSAGSPASSISSISSLLPLLAMM